jgi:steroid 5-alpha reductase family enzyme
MIYLLLAASFVVVWMSCIWLVYLLCKNPAIVDLAWTLSIGGISTIYYYLGEPSFATRLIYALMIIWTSRLTILIVYRLIKFKTDGRYEELDKKWAGSLPSKYFIFFMAQGAAAIVMTLPLLFIATFQKEHWMDVLGIFCMIIGLIGVISSDVSLQSFIAKKENRGEVCEKGLWKYSRHPNYFFEWVYWLGLFFFAVTVSGGWITILSPLTLLITLLFFTGIPAAEERSLITKKEKYIDYQRRVSSFIPWLPRK